MPAPMERPATYKAARVGRARMRADARFPRSPRGKVSGWDGQKKLRALGPAPSLSTCGAGPGAGIGGVRREAVWRRLRAHLFAKKGIFEKI